MVGGKGTAQAATGRGGRQGEGIGKGSDREWWEAEERHRQRQGVVGGIEAKGRHRQRHRQGVVGGGGKAQAATGSGGRQRDGTGSDRERWEAKGRHWQRC